MLIKGISELAIAPVQIDALEMILIRIAYSASLPTPFEILNDVKKNSNLNLSTPQNSQNAASAPIMSHAAALAEQQNSALANNGSGAVFNTPEEMAAYFEANRKLLLSYAIKNDIAISEFGDGFIKMTLSDKVSNDFMLTLQKELLAATGKNWKIETIRGQLGQTLAAKEHAEEEENKRSISEYPLVKAILAEFKGSKIETLTRLKQLEEEEGNLSSDDTETFFDEEL